MENRKSSLEVWVEAGYDFVGYNGFEDINVKKIADEIHLPRSSFYYYFKDLTDFRKEIFAYHEEVIKEFYFQGKYECKTFIPDFYNVISQYEKGLRFHFQLSRARGDEEIKEFVDQVFETTYKVFIGPLFKKTFDLDQSLEEIKPFLKILSDAWYSRLDINDLSAETIMELGRDIITTSLAYAKPGIKEKIIKMLAA